jgi:hypothetical protein
MPSISPPSWCNPACGVGLLHVHELPVHGLRLASSARMSAGSETLSQPSCGTEADRRPRPIAVSMPGAGMLWFAAWMFTIGVAQLSFWKAVLALVIWPYFIGVLVR